MLTRKLNCKEVQKIVKGFFEGSTIADLAREFNVGDSTIANILYRATYKDCYNPLDDFDSLDLYEQAVYQMTRNNRRLSKGRGRKKQ